MAGLMLKLHQTRLLLRVPRMIHCSHRIPEVNTTVPKPEVVLGSDLSARNRRMETKGRHEATGVMLTDMMATHVRSRLRRLHQEEQVKS
jgi:hypothetical protein